MLHLLFAWVVGAAAASAHDPGLSTATVDLSSREILVQVAFAPADLAALHPPHCLELARRVVELRTAAALLAPKTVETREVAADNVEFILRYPRPAGGGVSFRAPLLDRLPFGHRQALTVRDENGAVFVTELLSADCNFAPLPASGLPAAAQSRRVRLPLAAAALGVLALGWLIFPQRRVTAAA